MKGIGLAYLKHARGQLHANMAWHRFLAFPPQRWPFVRPAVYTPVNRPPKPGGRRVPGEEWKGRDAVSRRGPATTRAVGVPDRLPEPACRVAQPEQTIRVLSEHAVRDRWEDHLDYFGCAIHIRTEPVRAAGRQQADGACDLWESVLRIGLPPPADGTPEALAVEQIANGTRPGLAQYASLLGRQVPIGKDMVKTYASGEEAIAGHARLVIYLEQFMSVRHLFHPDIEEMQARRSAFLLGVSPGVEDAPPPGALLKIDRPPSSPLHNERKRSLLDTARLLLRRLHRGRASSLPNQARRRTSPDPSFPLAPPRAGR